MSKTITETVTDYVHAMTFADEERLRQLFAPGASIVGNFGAETEWLTLDDFIDQIKSAERGLQAVAPNYTILGIDQEGDTASVKMTDAFAGIQFNNYLCLLQQNENWSIVHKLYHVIDKAGEASP
jgi:hypothetical protein